MGFLELQTEVRRLFYDRFVKAAEANGIFLSATETPRGMVWPDASDRKSLDTLFASFDETGPQVDLLLELQKFAEAPGPLAERAAVTTLLGALRIIHDMACYGEFRKQYYHPDAGVMLTIKISIQQWYFAMRTFLLPAA